MKPLFIVKCSEELALALGARPMVKVDRPNLSFPVHDEPSTHYAEMKTDSGPFAWYWQLDATHKWITRLT